MLTKFESLNSDKLVVFLTGWGCDDIQFSNMTENNKIYDILICWDYSDLNFSHSVDFKKYKEIYLLTYSAGVYVAGLIKDKLPKFTKSAAINGHPLMFDKYYGIKDSVLNVFKNLNMSNYMQFRKDYVVNSEEELEFFNAHSSMRSIESCLTELNNLETYSKSLFTPYNYDIAIISENDKIFNPTTQKEYFQGKYILLENNAHNIFYRFQSLEDIISLIR